MMDVDSILAPGKVGVAPSVLSADFAYLGRDVLAIADHSTAIHLDIMDGNFVPNLSFGIPVVAAVRRVTRKPLDVHLMIIEPRRYVEKFAEAGADILTVHAEACTNLGETIDAIIQNGMIPGVALKPGTPADAVKEHLGKLGLILVMTVEPGFGGQKFMPEMVPKIQAVRKMIDATGRNIIEQVDGGIIPETALVAADGARLFVAGSSVYKHPQGPAEGIREIFESAQRGMAGVRGDGIRALEGTLVQQFQPRRDTT